MTAPDTEDTLSSLREDEKRPDGCLFSFVVIGRNEGDILGASIESVLRAADGLSSWECIFVDSASEDNSVETALRYPITVIRLKENTRLTAGAGRHVGTIHASGEFVMFLDGDCELQAGFLERAIEAFRGDDSLSTVVGTRGLVYDRGGDGANALAGGDVIWATEKDCEVVSTGGVAMIRKGALDSVGGFNPFMRSNEERELCLRLRGAGYRIRCIRHPMMVHHSYPWQGGEVTYRELWRRFRSGMMEGPGQLLRQAVQTGWISREHFEVGTSRALGLLVYFALGVVAVAVSLALGEHFWMAAWLAGGLAGYVVFAVKSRSIARSTYYVVNWALQAVAMVVGFVRGFRMRDGIAAEYHVIRRKGPAFRAVSSVGMCGRTGVP